MPSFSPFPDMIEEGCREVQATWDEETRLNRMMHLPKRDRAPGWTPPLISTEDLDGCIQEFFEVGCRTGGDG